MSYLIDTGLLSLLERKQVLPKLARWVQENESDIFLSVVSLAELQFGLDRAPATHKESLAELKTKNRTMTCEDSLIAATALCHNHTVVTHNERHFEPSGVQWLDPLK